MLIVTDTGAPLCGLLIFHPASCIGASFRRARARADVARKDDSTQLIQRIARLVKRIALRSSVAAVPLDGCTEALVRRQCC